MIVNHIIIKSQRGKKFYIKKYAFKINYINVFNSYCKNI